MNRIPVDDILNGTIHADLVYVSPGRFAHREMKISNNLIGG
jgi:hypothetical protein